MARSEARVSVAIWRDPDYRSLSFGAQWMYECLVSQSDLSYAGVLALRESRWARYASDLDADKVEGFLAELAERRYVVVDDTSGEVLVRSFMRHDEVWKQPNVLRAAVRAVGEIESSAILSTLVPEVERMATLEGVTERVADILAEMLETLRERLKDAYHEPDAGSSPNPSRNPSTNPSENPFSQDLKTEGGGGSVTAVRSDTPLPPLPAPSPPPTPSEPSLSRAAARPKAANGGKGTRIPDNFGITAEMRQWAADEVAGFDIDREHKRFRDYWRAKPGKDGTKLDWFATWRNWMRKAAQDGPPHRGRDSPASSSSKAIPPDQQCQRHRGQPGGNRDDGTPRCGQCRIETTTRSAP